jgi:hypothetical protein
MTKSYQPISRRTCLRGLGTAVALPWLDIMSPNTLRAASAKKPPLRFVTLFQPNGVFPGDWNIEGDDKNFELSPILEPLSDFRNEMIILNGIDGAGNGHVKLTAAFLTGVSLENGVNGISVDQMLARAIGKTTRFPSIVLGTEPPRQGFAGQEPVGLANTVSWISPTQRISPEINPRVAFDRLFRDTQSPEARREAINRQSVVDSVLQDAKALRRRGSKQDAQKLDEYLAGIRSVETQINRTLNPPEPEWTPLQPAKMDTPADGIPRRRDEHMRLMIDMIVLALQTDTTRVATFMSANGFSRQNFTFLDGVKSDHHSMSHHKNQASLIAEYTTVSRWYAAQVAYFLEKMQAISEGDSNLLDNSIVLYGSEMKDGNGHVKEDLPLVLFGKGQGQLRPGRLINCPTGTPVANLHLSLLQKFGVETESFNNRSTGVISELS